MAFTAACHELESYLCPGRLICPASLPCVDADEDVDEFGASLQLTQTAYDTVSVVGAHTGDWVYLSNPADGTFLEGSVRLSGHEEEPQIFASWPADVDPSRVTAHIVRLGDGSCERWRSNPLNTWRSLVEDWGATNRASNHDEDVDLDAARPPELNITFAARRVSACLPAHEDQGEG